MNLSGIFKNKLRKGFGVSHNLLYNCRKVSGVNMRISQRKHQFSRLEVAQMSNHISENAIRGDIIGEPQKTIRTSLANKTIQKHPIPTNMKLTSKMTGR